MVQVFHVGMADCVVSKHPANLVTLGLGSCIGLVLFDPASRTAGLVHIMLPDSHGAKSLPKEGKFADTAIPFLLEQLNKLGINKNQLKAKMAGGAQMFSMPGKENSLFAVGSKNTDVTTALLNTLGIKILASDTGGNKGRSIEFSTETLKLTVKTLGAGVKEL
ncbi:MAG: chemotaxis protein CheD [Synergistaceae bacterium]|jgi:chemotaxis protein CheD|nr:chemotaxis protein CheD [Synergistaceae bacterium]MBP9627282.1 chemotaxis protein CheD [Synergistaceae bacterium]MBP9958458.1 chemotaxis protein CheD [Synergistaceae bacterium]